MEILLRTAVDSDLLAINEIYNQAIATSMATADTVPYTMAEREAWFRLHSDSRYPAFVATGSGRVLAYCTLSPYRPRRAALDRVAEVSYFVHEEYRGMGIGSKLLAHLIEIAPSCGINHLVAILMGHNQASIGLLQKFGFAEWGRLPGIADYNGRSYDHLYYGRSL